MTSSLRHTVMAALLLFCGICRAENHALLVGISHYPMLKQLEGPQHDVVALDKTLTEKWSFPADNIAVLLNERATRENILQALDQLYKSSKPGDDIFIYYSGHGTSHFDPELRLPLPYTSGALIPYDVNPEYDEDKIVEQLIIGTRDLRPRLEKFDSGSRHLFVVVDACYSGSTIRGRYARHELPTRYVKLLSKSAKSISKQPHQRQQRKEHSSMEGVTDTSAAYPYSNVYYLGAASQYEKAVDIPAEWLDKYPTIDGKPHGAFTDSLLSVLNQPRAADIDNNGQLSYMELKQSVGERLQARRFNHTPQSLPILAEDETRLNRKPVFFLQPNTQLLASVGAAQQGIARPGPAAKNPPAIVAAHKASASKNIELAAQQQPPDPGELPHITFNSNAADINLIQTGNEYIFANPAGDMLYRQNSGDGANYVKQIKYFAWLEKVQSLLDSAQQKMLGELQGVGSGASLREGDNVGFTLYPSADGYLMIVNFTSAGEINLLYPAAEKENIRQQPNTVIRKHDFARVTAPFGRETAYALLFDNRLELPPHLLGATFSFEHPYAAELVKAISRKRKSMRVKKFTFYTAAQSTSEN